jgi:hypothetical protein
MAPVAVPTEKLALLQTVALNSVSVDLPLRTVALVAKKLLESVLDR